MKVIVYNPKSELMYVAEVDFTRKNIYREIDVMKDTFFGCIFTRSNYLSNDCVIVADYY